MIGQAVCYMLMVWEYGAGTGGFFDENRRGCVVFAEKVAEREEREERGGLNEILGDEHTSGGALEV